MREEYLHDGTVHLYDDTADTPTRYVVWQDTDAESPATWNSDDTIMVYNTPPPWRTRQSNVRTLRSVPPRLR